LSGDLVLLMLELHFSKRHFFIANRNKVDSSKVLLISITETFKD